MLPADHGDNKSLSEQIRKASENSVAEFIETMDEHIKQNLRKAVAKMLGFECKWGNEWAVDYCNGRTTTMSGYINDKAQKIITETIETILTPEVIEQCLNERRAAIIADFKERIRYRTRDIISGMVDECIKKYCEQFVVNINIALDKISTDIDITDPNVDSKFQEMLLKEFVKEHNESTKEE